MRYYVDTNVFINRIQAESPFHDECKRFLDLGVTKHISICTSVETIQEIVHVLQKRNNLATGIALAKLILKQNIEVLEIDERVIHRYVDLVSKYPKAASRDLMHLSVCAYNGIKPIVTLDKGFSQFKEVKVIEPADAL